ncbi:creatininase family protein, partial [Rhizobiaceae sp. 2RAB30]
AIAPHLVRMELAAADYPPVPADYGQSELSMGHLMRSGVFGDPTKASEEKGRRWLALAAERSAALWAGFLDRHNLPTGE